MAALIEPLNLWIANTNAWIVAPDGPGGECVLVDIPPEPDVLLARLTELELQLVAVIATHGHIDHVGGMGTVVRKTPPLPGLDPQVPVHIHDDDRHMLLDPVGSSRVLGQYLEGIDVTPPEVIRGLDDGDVVKGAGLSFEALHTPGHTPGSVCLRLEMEDGPSVLFSGDHLFAGSIGRTDLPGGSMEQLLASMVDKILPLPDDLTVLPGHGPGTTIGRERANNPYLVDLVSPS